jgi:hypothetical protein
VAASTALAAESSSLTVDTATAQPMAFEVSGETSAPAPATPSNAAARPPLAEPGEVRFPDMPQSWFAPRAPQEGVRSIASAWQRVARELPAHLDRDGALDGAPPFVNGVRVNPVDAIGVRVTFDNGVGLSDAAAVRLRQFDGLKEGFALLA